MGRYVQHFMASTFKEEPHRIEKQSKQTIHDGEERSRQFRKTKSSPMMRATKRTTLFILFYFSIPPFQKLGK
jgi:hypothetical protein